jgi:alpha-tubulin suppressor-like RCC1 family protein
VSIAIGFSVDKLTAGGGFSSARAVDGTLSLWGANQYGQLGLGNTNPSPKPVNVTVLGNDVQRISAGASHMCVFTADTLAWCWGDNRFGQLGLGDTNGRTTPTRLDSSLLSNVTQVAAGGRHTCALRNDGAILCWGDNRFGQLGLGDRDPRLVPTEVSALGHDVSVLYAGGAHTCAINTDGAVYCWGDNRYGQLGDGTTEAKSSPVQILPACQ